MAVVDDAAVRDLDPGSQVVGEPEAVGLLEGLEVLEDVGRWRVVMGDAEAERQLGPGAFHRPERNPRQRGDRRLNAHAELLFVPPAFSPERWRDARGLPTASRPAMEESPGPGLARGRWPSCPR